jgi:hypothetical protein
MPVLKTALQPEACCRHPGAASASLPHLEAGVQESLHMASGRVYPKYYLATPRSRRMVRSPASALADPSIPEPTTTLTELTRWQAGTMRLFRGAVPPGCFVEWMRVLKRGVELPRYPAGIKKPGGHPAPESLTGDSSRSKMAAAPW